LNQRVRLADTARTALAGVRLVNGAVGLFTPEVLARRLGADPEENPALLYALRLFGVRTIVIAVQLHRREPTALRTALPIHASDTLAAVLLARRLPRRQGAAVVGISALNTLLALQARRTS
jgi:hypothetical protein